jgi:GTP-binding protein HflX
LRPNARERAILAGLDLKSREADYTAEESLEELATLAESAHAEVVGTAVQARQTVDAATFVGSGKAEELARQVAAERADVVIFDQELSPTQQRNLERTLGCRVVDRTQLILDIFAQRARTREGQLQVELAQLDYLLPRLAGRGVEMSRLGGGIGTRGPGETQLETDRRRIGRRIKKIRDELAKVRAGRDVQRRQRQAVPLATLSLVGYTNAGKSTLFNRLTGAEVLADAKMFATLDPTVRQVQLPSNRRVLVSDTVGFIRSLPTTLVEAFRATLEEVVQAALLLHVVDVTSPHAAAQTEHVFKVLTEIGAADTPQLLILNKVDCLPSGEADTVAARILGAKAQATHTRAVAISAWTGQGIPELLAAIDAVLPADPIVAAKFRFPVGEGAPLSMVHDRGRVLSTRYDAEHCEVEAEVPTSLKTRLSVFVIPD